MATVHLTIKAFEPVEVDLKGFQGQGCKGVADAFAQAMRDVTHRHRKPEFHQGSVATTADEQAAPQAHLTAGGW